MEVIGTEGKLKYKSFNELWEYFGPEGLWECSGSAIGSFVWDQRQNEIDDLKKQLEQQKFNNEHNLSIDQQVSDKIKQLEARNQESEKKNQKLIKSVELACSAPIAFEEEVVRLKAELAEAVKVISFYADEHLSWEGENGQIIIPQDREVTINNQYSGGKRARLFMRRFGYSTESEIKQAEL